MTDLKSLLAERRAKAMGNSLGYGYFEEESVVDYVDLLEKVIERQNEVLKYYADYMNYSVDHDTSGMGFSRRCILYGDIEERNEATGLAGRRARESQSEVRCMLTEEG